MTEAEWLACTDPMPMLEFLWGKASDRKLRLFAVACCRRIGHLLTDDRSRIAVETFERFADEPSVGLAQVQSLAEQARIEAHQERGVAIAFQRTACLAIWWLLSDQPTNALRWATCAVSDYNIYASMKVRNNLKRQERRWQASVLRDVAVNPFRPSPPLPSAVLAWNDGTVRHIAEGIYEERKMPEGRLDNGRLAILADALLDAGCEDEDLIQHCRSDGPHVRGCWAIDLLLGRG
jgi:hypothetical protein